MFVMKVPYFDIDQLYKSGQCYRMIKITDGKYVIPVRDTAVKVEQVKETLILSCTDEQFFKKWYDYLDVKTDYSDINFKIKGMNDDTKIASVRAKGVRILKQDLYETIITQVIKNDNTDAATKAALDYLSRTAGKKHNQSFGDSGFIVWRELPQPDKVTRARNKLDDRLLKGSKQNLLEVCEDIETNKLNLRRLSQMDFEQAKVYLSAFPYFTIRMIKNICLYALGFTEVVPFNHIIKETFNRVFWTTSLKSIKEMYFEDHDYIGGHLYMYLMYCELNKPKEAGEEDEWD